MPCHFQPRKHFPEQKLNELGLNLRKNGVINPLTVRIKSAGGHVSYEIICGECRWRSSDERPHPENPGEKMPAMEELPIIVRDLTDVQALELMLSENIKRNDLSPMEECDAFALALEQKDEAGNLVHTQETLAEKIGVTRQLITERLSLRKLPKEGREALLKGAASYRVLREACRSPRSIVAKIVDVILNPRKFPSYRWQASGIDAPITIEEVRELANQMSADLTAAPFSLDDAALAPLKTDEKTGEQIEGGPCTTCTFNTANQPKEGETVPGRRGETIRCLNAKCYARKVEIHVQSALVKAKESGAEVLKDNEANKILTGGPNGTPSLDYVELDEKLDQTERAPGVSERKAPTWAEVASDSAGKLNVPVKVAVDSRGRVRRFAERKVVVASAEKTGKAKLLSLSTGRGRSLQQSEAEKADQERRKKENETQKLRLLTNRKAMGALVGAVIEQGVPADAWEHFFEMAMGHASHSGCLYVCGRRDLEKKPDVYTAVRKHAKTLKGSELMALTMELLLSQPFSWSGNGGEKFSLPDSAKPIFKHYGVDVKTVETEAKAELAEKKKPKAEVAAKADPYAGITCKACGSQASGQVVLDKLGSTYLCTKCQAWDFDVIIAHIKAGVVGPITGETPKAPGKKTEPPDVWIPWKRLELDQVALVEKRFKGTPGSKLKKQEYKFDGGQVESRPIRLPKHARPVRKKAKQKAGAAK